MYLNTRLHGTFSLKNTSSGKFGIVSPVLRQPIVYFLNVEHTRTAYLHTCYHIKNASLKSTSFIGNYVHISATDYSPEEKSYKQVSELALNIYMGL